MEKTIIARWQSRGGKTWVELFSDTLGYSYTGNDCGGNLGALPTPKHAIAEIENRLYYLTPDAHKNFLKRVK